MRLVWWSGLGCRVDTVCFKDHEFEFVVAAGRGRKDGGEEMVGWLYVVSRWKKSGGFRGADFEELNLAVPDWCEV